MFSKEGPNLIRPALTNKPKVIPKIYKLKNNRSSGRPNFKIETPALIHSMEGLEKLKESLENLTSKGGNIKKKKENLKNYIKHLLDIEEIFKNKGINQYSKLAEELRSQLSDITD